MSLIIDNFNKINEKNHAEEKVNKSVMQNAKEIEQNPHQKSSKDLSNPNDIQRGMELF